ncbi:MAG: PAS domain S-box protein [Chloroflexota bacterium]|nr:PAS domain S-box protein [Chloroflexota bacterium]
MLRLDRRWPLSSYLALLAALFVLTGTLSVLFVHARAEAAAIADAKAEVQAQARLVSADLSTALSTLDASVARTAATPNIGALFRPSAPCSLSFSLGSLFPQAHLDLIDANGVVVCSSNMQLAPIGSSYAAADWWPGALRAATFAAPTRDARTGDQLAVSAAPIPGSGVLAGIVDLAGLGPALAARFEGAERFEYFVTTADGHTALARSIDASRWVGAPLAKSSFGAGGGEGSFGRDVDGVPRLYASASVPPHDWQLYIGVDQASVLAQPNSLLADQIVVTVVALLALLAAVVLVYRRIATPIARLNEAMAVGVDAAAISPSGPAEVSALAEKFNALTAAVRAELAERRRAEADARRLGAVVDQSTDAVIGFDLDGSVTDWNRGAELLLGLPRSEIVGRSIAQLMPSGQTGPLLARLRAGESITNYETVYVRPDGSPVHVSVNVSPVLDAQDLITGVSVIARDVTERWRQEQAIKSLHEVAFETGHALEPERLAQFTVDRARDVLAIETAALYWFEETEQVLKLLARSTTGAQSGRERIHLGEGISGIAFERREPVVVEDYPNWPHGIPGTIASGVAVPLIVGQRAVGTLILSSYTPHKFAATDVEFLSLFASEVAPALEAARLKIVEQRQQVVEEASRAKSAFLANMSHELRTPLNAILGFSKLLLEQLTMTPRQRVYLQNVRDAGANLLDLINDVLDISRVESGRMELHLETIRLPVLLEPVIASARLAAEARGLRFEAQATEEAIVSVDATRMRQILNNLLSNAVKFTPAGQVTLRAFAEEDALLLEVSDTGIGIPTARQARVFGTFERLHEGVLDAPGTGLGLALTKQLVELHHGTISFESAEGVGTTFRVRLPDAIPQAVAGSRVLVVEDDRRDGGLIVALAQARGLRTEVVGTVADALAAITRQVPAGMVLDLRLPDGRGEQVLDAVRMNGRRIPVIVVTVEDDGAALGSAVDDYLTKPLDAERLNRWLARLASQEGVAGADPSR